MGILRNIGNVHGDSYATIGVGRVALGIAHSVNHLLLTVRSGWDDDTARTHAKRENTVTLHLCSKAVGGRR